MTILEFNDKINTILCKGQGLKSILFDLESSKIISNMVPYSVFLENNFFLFEYIGSDDRSVVRGVCCVVVIRNVSVNLLFKEIKKPLYDEYIIIFTNKIGERVLEELADNDRFGVVKEVYEIYMDVFYQDVGMYTVMPVKYGGDCIERCVDGIYSFLVHLNVKPSIRVIEGRETVKIIGETLKRRFGGEEYKNGGELVIVDRGCDMITPLLYKWRYQGMIYEHLEYKDGLVQFKDKFISVFDDSFFIKNRFLDINSVGENIKRQVKEVEKNKKIKNNEDVCNLEEKSKIVEIAENHLLIYNYLAKECLENKELSELELNIIKNNKITIKEISNICNNKCVNFRKRIKILLIYLIKNDFDFLRNSYQDNLFSSKVVQMFPEFIQIIKRFGEKYIYGDCSDKNGIIKTKKYLPVFLNEYDVKLDYVPGFYTFLESVIKKNLKEKYFPYILKSTKEYKYTIIYFNGGLTYEEYRIFNEFCNKNTKLGNKMFLLCDKIIGYNDIFINII
ncbi:Sec1-like vacuolar protein sorting-associated protein [Hamiltosporidium tvaerminnensis]|uniref:Sec1-like vacuolar protein sorting-associated protein n=1 Tax=Hamiltosporidium tvaerminnensis TaxID=1176355 RepID=A0A4Q9LZC0_9MICR|nr:Sec1-like vacuolar protein sorting-associated protein [Hamiltosporidium tvaerminnensis]